MNTIYRPTRIETQRKPVAYAGMLAVLATACSAAAAELPLLSADTGMKAQEWRIINDGVMGGRSQSAIGTQPDGSLVFKGNVSLENNGGFASTRGPKITQDLAGFEGVELVVVGDGNAYKCGIRTDNDFDGVAHQTTFNTTAGTETRIRIPFSDFKPTWRGRVLPDVEPLSPGAINNIGFLIADKQEGAFQLEIKSISAYRTTSQGASDIISVATQAGTFNTLLAAIDAAGLTDAVRSLEGVTLFAPTDEAFAKLPADTLAALLEPRNKDTLVNILTYHAVDQEVAFSTATTLSRTTALNGEEITVSVKKGALNLNEARVVENDIQTSNGIIHVIDAVLLPPEWKLAEVPPTERIIGSAIRRGVPLFNSGNAQACADLYELAAEALLSLPDDTLNAQQRTILTTALGNAKQQRAATDRAWTMRIALDKTLAHAEA